MPKDLKKDIVDRLSRVEGQVRGLKKMVEEERDCYEIVNQLAAARKALDKVGFIILTTKLEECLKKKSAAGEPADGAIKETLELFMTLA